MSLTKSNLYLKIGVIIIITLVLLIPTTLIRSLVSEREITQNEAIVEVTSKWGDEQTLSGPFLTIPYYKIVENSNTRDTVNKVVRVKEFMHFLPTELNVNSELLPQERSRGIYDVVVYNSTVHIQGKFDNVDFSGWDIPMENIQFDKAFLSYGITDLRGIQKQVALKWDDKDYLFNPGTETKNIIQSGINSPVELKPVEGESYTFDFILDLKGSQKLYFAPVGEVTDINMRSEWNNPSFNGSFLPDTHEVTENGFTANWNVLHLNRNYPQKWLNAAYNISVSEFGVDLLLPVDNYQKSIRAIKYAILLIGFSFIAFFFVEVIKKLHIHSLQYLLVGAALVVFYTLLLSISEYIGFNKAFVLSSVATIGLISVYVRAILKSTPLTLMISGVLIVLYALVFVIIQLQDFSLLIGSVSIFVILAIIMFVTRKFDWDSMIKRDKKNEKKPAKRAAETFGDESESRGF